jgi:hypothetical protein
MFDVQSLTGLSAGAGLLKLKVCPAATYRIELIRQDLVEKYKNQSLKRDT